MLTHTVSEIMSQNLAAKASAMNSYQQQCALGGNIASVAYSLTTPENVRSTLHAAIQNAHERAYRQMRSEAKMNIVPVNQQISNLREAPLADKRKLLDSLPIISVPIGAAFLGVADADLYHLNSQSCGVFGDIFLRRQCNSMSELLLIAQNPGWLRYRPDGAPPLTLPDSKMLYGMTFVDISTAMAYTNMSLQELQMKTQQIYRFHRCNFTYRVSDLEDIHIAKLKAQQK